MSPTPPADPQAVARSRRWPRVPALPPRALLTACTSIFAKQLFSYLVLIGLMGGVIGLLVLATARNNLAAEVGRKLEYVARIAAEATPLERLELIRPGDEEARMVLRLKQKLAQIQDVTGVDNIHVFSAEDRSLLDLRNEVPIGNPGGYTELTPSLWERLRLGRSVHTEMQKGDNGPVHITAFAPVLAGDGQLAAVVGVEGGRGELAAVDRMRTRLYWILMAGAASAVALALAFARSISSPVQRIARTAERLGHGDYSARALVRGRGEVASLADSINAMAEQIRQRDGALKAMVAGVAHEIRNPLNSIKLLLSLLGAQLADRRTAPIAQTMATLDYEIGKLNRLIAEFLTYARPLTLRRDRVEVGELLASAAEMAAAEAAEREVGLTVEVGPGLPDLLADRQRLEQVLLNFLLNGIQACPPGGRVVLRAVPSTAPTGVDFAIEDTGPGIAGEAMDHLFEPFFTTKADGTGLGLANARKIAEEHQGEVLAENRPEGGARFVLRLPAEHLLGRL